MHASSKHMAEDIRKEYAARRMLGTFSLSPWGGGSLSWASSMQGPGLCHSRQGKRIAGYNLKARAMGFEPTQFALVKLESVLTGGMTKSALKAPFKIHETKNACLDQPAV